MDRFIRTYDFCGKRWFWDRGRLWCNGKPLWALVFFLATCTLHGQQKTCTLHADFSMGASQGVTTASAAGNTLLLNTPPDTSRNITICAVYLGVTQGATAANIQLRGCTDNTCSVQQTLTPLLTGHANYVDTYTFAPYSVVEPVLRGRGVYLYLSAAPTAANVQIFYSDN